MLKSWRNHFPQVFEKNVAAVCGAFCANLREIFLFPADFTDKAL